MVCCTIFKSKVNLRDIELSIQPPYVLNEKVTVLNAYHMLWITPFMLYLKTFWLVKHHCSFLCLSDAFFLFQIRAEDKLLVAFKCFLIIIMCMIRYSFGEFGIFKEFSYIFRRVNSLL